MSLPSFISSRLLVAPLLVALVLAAFAINRFAPSRRRRLRRGAILFVLAALVEIAAYSLDVAGVPSWPHRLRFGAEILEAFTAIEIGAILLFDLALPSFGVRLAALASDLVVGAGYIIATLALVRAQGVELDKVLTTSAIVSGILALSLQQTLGNVIGGVALQLDGSIHVGDWVQLENGRQGKVKQIRWRHTVLETRDWGTLIVPNATLLSSQILVLGKREGKPHQHRYWVYFNVDFRYAPQRVIAAVNEALQGAPIPNVASDPPPHCICLDFASPTRDSFAYYAVRFWLTDLAVDDPTCSAVRERIHAALRRADIPLARPASTTFYVPGGEKEERAKRARHAEKRRAALRGMELFKTLKPEELESLVDRLKFAPFAKGERITRKGAVAHWLYILTAGSVEISIPADDGRERVIIAQIEAPGFFGEMGMMTGEPRAADVYARTDVDCYRLDKAGFEAILKARPEIAKEMSETLARRRIQLLEAKDEIDDAPRSVRQQREAAEILDRIKRFFGL
jgi:CRP-like cAMP-binding protein/small-conductance mechanosensitive channel